MTTRQMSDRMHVALAMARTGTAWEPPPPGVNAKDWEEHAACKGLDPTDFYPENAEDEVFPLRVCWRSCPAWVRSECLIAGQDERWGIWGGVTERERRAFKLRSAA